MPLCPHEWRGGRPRPARSPLGARPGAGAPARTLAAADLLNTWAVFLPRPRELRRKCCGSCWSSARRPSRGSGPVPRGALGCWERGKDVPAAEPSALNAQRNPQGWAFEHSRPTLRRKNATPDINEKTTQGQTEVQRSSVGGAGKLGGFAGRQDGSRDQGCVPLPMPLPTQPPALRFAGRGAASAIACTHSPPPFPPAPAPGARLRAFCAALGPWGGLGQLGAKLS